MKTARLLFADFLSVVIHMQKLIDRTTEIKDIRILEVDAGPGESTKHLINSLQVYLNAEGRGERRHMLKETWIFTDRSPSSWQQRRPALVQCWKD